MASTFKAVTDTMNDLNIVVWNVKGRSGSLLGFQHNEKLDLDLSIDRLKKLLSEIRGETVRVELQPTNKIGKGGNQRNIIKMDVDLSTVNPVSISGITPVQSGDFKRLESMLQSLMERNETLQAELIKSRYEGKIADLEKQIAGIAEAEKNDPIGRVIDLVIPILANYVPKMMTPKSPDINGTITVDSAIESAVVDLLQSDPDEGIAVLQAVARLAKNKPDVYKQYKPLLLQL